MTDTSQATQNQSQKRGKVIFTTRATAHGGRAGYIETPDHHLGVKLSVPQEIGGDGGVGTNPEQLFAAGYAACFQSAIGSVARREKVSFGSSRVTGVVGLVRDELGFALDVELQIVLPGLSREQAQHMVEEAHKVCPYSRALRGNVDVRLTVIEEPEHGDVG
ncbi:Ohr subfamily peroxiredoxin [Deinococcus aerius]|uniref:Ohr subfamily peroxiredoxin n=1 Tax=Deinococcus aerius TaxID=200253 RepID=A0A2I9DH87_9DEIO|nr:organic hydroperoxide resistance protein [Deinococcus aerius]GBF05538.1 Ohr subfamily peroxiredoxin [Deinococcus aerius]